MRVLLAQINPTIGDFKGNSDKIIDALKRGKEAKADIVLYPELCLTGYPPDDFLSLPHFIDASDQSLKAIISECKDITAIIGVPRKNPDQKEKGLYNSAAIIQ